MFGALAPGMGGGGGGGAPGAAEFGIGGGGGAEDAESKEPGIGKSCTGVAGLLSIAESGLGGAIVPKSIDARCFAEPPTGAGPSSSLDSFLSDSASQSSSSCRRRDLGFSASC